MTNMTFEAFQATRTYAEDADNDLIEGSGYDHRVAYLIYLGCLIIAQITAVKPEYELILGNSIFYSHDLESLEHKLYEYAMAEGFASAQQAQNDAPGEPLPANLPDQSNS